MHGITKRIALASSVASQGLKLKIPFPFLRESKAKKSVEYNNCLGNFFVVKFMMQSHRSLP
jgi:hypothetical protein